MELSQDFRARAQRCLALAGAAPTIEAQTHWLGMAQLWLNLAQYSEDQDARFLSENTRHLADPHAATDAVK
jgi:hypothetical protein